MNDFAHVLDAATVERMNRIAEDVRTKSRGEMAYTLVDVDSPVGDAVMAGLRGIEGVLAVRYLPLEE